MSDQLLLDEFDYANTSEMSAAGWYLRGTQYGSTPSRVFSRADWSAVVPMSGFVRLKILPDLNTTARHLVGHITRGLLPAYGWFEADIQFGRPKGAHGAFWIQSGYEDGQAELDIVEFFGERMPGGGIDSQRVQHTVHTGPVADGLTRQNPRYTYTTEDNDHSDVLAFEGKGQFGLNRTWWNKPHTYACEWSPTGYRFFVDGTPVGRTVLPQAFYSAPSASEEALLILSNLSNDGDERDALLAYVAAGGSYADFNMDVHRVEVRSL